MVCEGTPKYRMTIWSRHRRSLKWVILKCSKSYYNGFICKSFQRLSQRIHVALAPIPQKNLIMASTKLRIPSISSNENLRKLLQNPQPLEAHPYAVSCPRFQECSEVHKAPHRRMLGVPSNRTGARLLGRISHQSFCCNNSTNHILIDNHKWHVSCVFQCVLLMPINPHLNIPAEKKQKLFRESTQPKELHLRHPAPKFQRQWPTHEVILKLVWAAALARHLVALDLCDMLKHSH